VPESVRLIEAGGDLTTLLDLWEDQPFVIVVDAVRSGHPPGTVLRIEVGDQPLPSPLNATSTHGFSLGGAVALGQTIGRFPGRLVIYGIEAASFGPGTDRTPAVARAVGGATRRIVEELKTGKPSVGSEEPTA
jgi:hydrogenase maturation protease